MLKKAVGSYVLRKKVEANWLDAHTHRIALRTYPIKVLPFCSYPTGLDRSEGSVAS